jgi:hypothetical protein
MPARRDNWPNLLAQFIEQRREQPFAWGVNDCCIFAADWVEVCTGEDYAKTWRNRYSSGLGAVRFLDEAGRGDIVAQEAGRGMTLGICLGVTTAFVTKNGLAFGSIANAEKSWKV